MNEQQILAESLPRGAENAVSPKILAQRLGLKSTRKLRKVIEAARNQGELILSDYENGGYYQPDTGEKGRQETARFYWEQRKHAIAILKRLRAARLALDIPLGQLSIDGEAQE